MLSKGAIMTEKIKIFKHNSICIDVGDRAVYVDIHLRWMKHHVMLHLY